MGPTPLHAEAEAASVQSPPQDDGMTAAVPSIAASSLAFSVCLTWADDSDSGGDGDCCGGATGGVGAEWTSSPNMRTIPSRRRTALRPTATNGEGGDDIFDIILLRCIVVVFGAASRATISFFQSFEFLSLISSTSRIRFVSFVFPNNKRTNKCMYCIS